MDELTPLKTDHKQFIAVIQNCTLATGLKHKNTIVKYTKLPQFDSRASWSHHNYLLQPRLRRVVTLEDQPIKSSRSLEQNSVDIPLNMISTNYPKRKIKIITIEDDADLNCYSKLPKDVKKTVLLKTTNRSAEANYGDGKLQCPQRSVSRVTGSANYLYSKETKRHISKSKDLSNKNEMKKQTEKHFDNKQARVSANEHIIKTLHVKEKDTPQSIKKSNNLTRISSCKNITVTNQGKESHATKQQLFDSLKKSVSSNKPNNKTLLNKTQNHHNRLEVVNNILRRNKPITVVCVPPDDKLKNQCEKENKICNKDGSTEVNKTITYKDISVGTEPMPNQVDQDTEIDINFNKMCETIDSSILETNVFHKNFDSLNIPKVTLKKERRDLSSKEVVNFYSTSLPNLKTPSVEMIPINSEKCRTDSRIHKNSSYIIGRATVTYTREQKIDFHVVEKNQEITTNICSTSLSYPINVVSIFKNEKSRSCHGKKSSNADESEFDLKRNNDTVNWRHISESNKLVKPSDIISTIRVNNRLLKSDYICEQFQRELNFIDSFFESLQYLEKLSERCFADVNLDGYALNKSYEVNSSEYVTNFTKIENGPNVDDTETMATKSLCQLNLLIHNEQRRARDFLFVLKMQEDVLKDYIKSQMLWLEKKKKQDNTDISALKKKQRGALLKLQHECGEMQRMRKALLTLSEKRKVALMRTKKNIEMKLKNNVNVEQILLGKKKLKRTLASERSLTPVKCFELSSSGCEDTTTSRAKSDSAWYGALVPDSSLLSADRGVTSAEKSIQTGESILAVDAHSQSSAAASENCIVVDGSYLNILFHNLSLPQIFSGGKQYEVNEEALKNIVNSSNSRSNISKDTDAIERFVEQVRNHESESSSASTAHSLVEEFDQYYKCLEEDDMSLTNSPDPEYKPKEVDAGRDYCDLAMMAMESDESLLKRLSEVYGAERPCVCEPVSDAQGARVAAVGASVAGPLPVPAGEAAAVESKAPDLSQWTHSKVSSDTDDAQNDPAFCSNMTTIPQYASPVLYEAEELRRQQLAIEREIKALEQQQCLLVVREIPDKPPPPYTPPSEARMPKPPRMFLKDGVTEEKIHKHFIDLSTDIFDISDPFDAFVKDFCEESIKAQQSGRSDKPWDAFNLLPQKPQPDKQKTVERTCTELKEVLSGVTPTYVSGVGSRRTDHIDDILFAEWRRCEPEWTSLHTDEAIVKNQLFDSIFQKILNETIGEYKRIVCNDNGDK